MIGTARQLFERRADQLTDFWRFSCETFPRIATAGEAADLEPERRRIVAVAKLMRIAAH